MCMRGHRETSAGKHPLTRAERFREVPGAGIRKWWFVAKHCEAGCTLGDIAAERFAHMGMPTALASDPVKWQLLRRGIKERM